MKHRILVADDDESARTGLAELLSTWGYEVDFRRPGGGGDLPHLVEMNRRAEGHDAQAQQAESYDLTGAKGHRRPDALWAAGAAAKAATSDSVKTST